MTYQSGKPILREIAVLAARQGGYFTARQAAGLGYDRRRLAYHADAGNFERAGRGLYRVPTMPLSEHDDLVRASFWSRDADDRAQAVVSHRTALALHGLGDLFAGSIHLTVPPGFRKAAPRGYVLHRGAVDATELEDREGFRVTNPLRTLMDAAQAGDVGDDELAKAVGDAIDRGMVRLARLRDAAERGGVSRLLRALEGFGVAE